jgi:hypothetical protein
MKVLASGVSKDYGDFRKELVEKRKYQDLQNIHVGDELFELFMKFDNHNSHEEIQRLLRLRAENPNARLPGEENMWSKLAVVILKCMKS